MSLKSIGIFGQAGAGKRTLIGSLIYRCGLDLPRLKELERDGVREYAQIVPYFKRKAIELSFTAPSSQFLINKTTQSDVALWVVDATDSDQGKASSEGLASSLSTAEIQPREKLIIVVNKMDLVQWSAKVFGEIERAFNSIKLGFENVHIIPISAIEGKNMLDPLQDSSWITALSTSRSTGSISVSAIALMYLL